MFILFATAQCHAFPCLVVTRAEGTAGRLCTSGSAPCFCGARSAISSILHPFSEVSLLAHAAPHRRSTLISPLPCHRVSHDIVIVPTRSCRSARSCSLCRQEHAAGTMPAPRALPAGLGSSPWFEPLGVPPSAGPLLSGQGLLWSNSLRASPVICGASQAPLASLSAETRVLWRTSTCRDGSSAEV